MEGVNTGLTVGVVVGVAVVVICVMVFAFILRKRYNFKCIIETKGMYVLKTIM